MLQTQISRKLRATFLMTFWEVKAIHLQLKKTVGRGQLTKCEKEN